MPPCAKAVPLSPPAALAAVLAPSRELPPTLLAAYSLTGYMDCPPPPPPGATATVVVDVRSLPAAGVPCRLRLVSTALVRSDSLFALFLTNFRGVLLPTVGPGDGDKAPPPPSSPLASDMSWEPLSDDVRRLRLLRFVTDELDVGPPGAWPPEPVRDCPRVAAAAAAAAEGAAYCWWAAAGFIETEEELLLL